MVKSQSGKISDLFIVIENANLGSLKNCCDDLAKRNIRAVVTLGEDPIENGAGLVKGIAQQGFDICGKLASEF